MGIPVKNIDKNHEKAISKGFAPWNLYRRFSHKDGGVVRLMDITYEFVGNVKVYFEVAGNGFHTDITHKLDDYQILEAD